MLSWALEAIINMVICYEPKFVVVKEYLKSEMRRNTEEKSSPNLNIYFFSEMALRVSHIASSHNLQDHSDGGQGNLPKVRAKHIAPWW